MKRLIVCMKWGTLYGPEYVNLLHRAIAQHLPEPHEFLCLTDDATGFDASILVDALPDMPMDAAYWKKGGWAKLAVVKSGFAPAGTRVLFVDLDTVILGNLTGMFETGPEVTMVKEWKRFVDYVNPMRPRKKMSSVFAFDAERETAIYDAFAADPAKARREFRIEQYFLDHYASAVNTWPDGWMTGFKRELLPPRFGVRKGTTVPKPPAEAKMLVFHGEPRPIDVVQNGVWGKRFRYGQGPVPYLLEYWRHHGVEPQHSSQ